MLSLKDLHHHVVNLELVAHNKVKEHKGEAKAARDELGDSSKLWPQGMPKKERYKYEDKINHHEGQAEKWEAVRKSANHGYVNGAFRDDPSWLASHGELYNSAMHHGRLEHSSAEEKAGMY